MNPITRILVYDAMYVAGFALMLTANLLGCRKYGISRARAAVYSFITFLSGLCGALLIGAIYNALFSLKGIETDIKVDVLGAVIFTSPLLLAAVSVEKRSLKNRARETEENGTGKKIRTVSFRDTMDLMIPGSFIVFACIKIGCHIKGCCHGVIWDHGIRSPLADVRLFPVQLCEAATMCLILILCYLMKRTRFYRRGMTGPLAANLYGIARFGWEFARFYTPEMRNFALGLSLWQIFALLVIAVSAVWLTVLYKTQSREPLRAGGPGSHQNKRRPQSKDKDPKQQNSRPNTHSKKKKRPAKRK